jgi:hypothetical protein
MFLKYFQNRIPCALLGTTTHVIVCIMLESQAAEIKKDIYIYTKIIKKQFPTIQLHLKTHKRSMQLTI